MTPPKELTVPEEVGEVQRAIIEPENAKESVMNEVPNKRLITSSALS